MPIFTQNLGLVGIFSKDFNLPEESKLTSTVGAQPVRHTNGGTQIEWEFSNGVIVRKEIHNPTRYRLEVKALPGDGLSYDTARQIFLALLPSGRSGLTSLGVNSLSILLDPPADILKVLKESGDDGGVLFNSSTSVIGVQFRTTWNNATLNVKVNEQGLAPTHGAIRAYLVDTNFDFTVDTLKELRSILSSRNLANLQTSIGEVFDEILEVGQ